MEYPLKLDRCEVVSHLKQMQESDQSINLKKLIRTSIENLTKSISYASFNTRLLDMRYHVFQVQISKHNQSNTPQRTHSNLQERI